MSRKCWMFAMLALLLGERITDATEHPSASWCIPTILRPTSMPYAQTEPAPPPPPVNHRGYSAPDLFGSTLETTADRLYWEAVVLQCRGKSERAAEKFIVLLEECPSYRYRDDAIARLNDMACQWLRDTRRGRRRENDFAGAFSTHAESVAEHISSKSRAEALGKQALDAVQAAVAHGPPDDERFRWDWNLHAFPEGWEWIEDSMLEVPGFRDHNGGGAIGIWSSAGQVVEFNPRPSSTPRWDLRSRFLRETMMRLRIDKKPSSPSHLPGVHWSTGAAFPEDDD
jgi:hypothetical protein